MGDDAMDTLPEHDEPAGPEAEPAQGKRERRKWTPIVDGRLPPDVAAFGIEVRGQRVGFAFGPFTYVRVSHWRRASARRKGR